MKINLKEFFNFSFNFFDWEDQFCDQESAIFISENFLYKIWKTSQKTFNKKTEFNDNDLI